MGTTGFDKNGNRMGTRETKQGDAANAEAERMMGQMGPMIGLMGMLNQIMGSPRRDPMEEFMEQMIAGAMMEDAGQVLDRQSPRIRMIPLMEELHQDGESGHESHHHHNGHCCGRHHEKKPVELDVIKP